MATTQNPILANIERFFNTLDHKIEKPVRSHLKNVYGALAMCLLAAAGGAYIHVATDLLRGNFLCSLGSLGLMLLLYSTPDTGANRNLRLGYFLGFGALTGLGTGPLLDYAIFVNPGIIVTAFLGTCILFGCFTLAALYAPDRKFLYLGGILMRALSTLVWLSLATLFWLSLANLFFQVSSMFTFQLWAGLAVMSAFVLYDTQLIIEKRRQGDTDYVWHAVDLFVDFMDIFRRLLIILSQKEQNKKRRD